MSGMKLSEIALRELLAEHAVLKQLLEELEALPSDVQEIPHNAANMLHELRWRLGNQFESEEKEGYLSEALAIAPNLIAEAERLRQEHGMFLKEVEQLWHWAEERTEVQVAVFRDRYRKFVERYLNHEHHENSLVQNAFDLDVGTGD
ncbi:MAG: hypothetical protein COA78_24665 [Blastopirellula sp.]|nr:MAG: hypothetical protein COA78_24665 [Blastopirellula sp.]